MDSRLLVPIEKPGSAERKGTRTNSRILSQLRFRDRFDSILSRRSFVFRSASRRARCEIVLLRLRSSWRAAREGPVKYHYTITKLGYGFARRRSCLLCGFVMDFLIT